MAETWETLAVERERMLLQEKALTDAEALAEYGEETDPVLASTGSGRPGRSITAA